MKHKKPTTKQKIAIYTEALAFIESNKATGICTALSYVKCNLGLSFSTCTDFPEIIKHKPVDKGWGEFWWSTDEKGKQIRINILKEEIILLTTKPTLLEKLFGWMTIEINF